LNRSKEILEEEIDASIDPAKCFGASKWGITQGYSKNFGM